MEIFFRKNLTYLRTEAGRNQTEVATALSFKRTTYANYESGHTEPNFEAVSKIVNYWGVKADEMLFTDFSNGKIQPISENGTKGKILGKEKGKIYPMTEQKSMLEEMKGNYVGQPPNVYDLDSKAAAGLSSITEDSDKQNILPKFFMPGLGPGFHIRLSVTGDSMHPTIKNMDMVIATKLLEWPAGLRPGDVYIVLKKTEDVVCKRIYWADAETLEMVSDNDTYKPYNRHLSDIEAVFKVRQVQSSDLHNYSLETRKELREIWKAIDEIRLQKAP